jgi:maltose alpha-D-glucosyltransferase/alpha-amylase
MDPVYGYEAVNVETQRESSASLLRWNRRMIGIRRRNPALSLGPLVELGTSNLSVFAFVREYGEDRVLCVYNLSRFPQPTELDLQQYKGMSPVELTGEVPFPVIGDMPYLVTLAGHGFYWFRLDGTPLEGGITGGSSR